MIINGKALVRVMKEAKKYGGYRVYMDGAYTVIRGGAWMVRCVTKSLPPTVFGQVAADLMQWPENGECWYVRKGEAQKELSADTEELLKGMDTATGVPLRRTPLTLYCQELWQTLPGMEIVAFDPELTNICTEMKPEYITKADGGNAARWIGCVSSVWVCPISRESTRELQVAHLEELAWVEE